MNLGILSGESIAQYHATDAVSHSKLERFRDPDRGPARFHGEYIAKTIPRQQSTDALDIGQSVDVLVLEKRTVFAELPPTYLDDKGVEKKWTMASNTCKGIHAAAVANGLIPLHRDDCKLVRDMNRAVYASPTAAALLSTGSPQVTMRAQLGLFAVQVRPDWWNPAGTELPEIGRVGPYIADLKTAEDMDQFMKNRRNFGYSRQNALYCEVARLVLALAGGVPVEEVERPAFFFIVVFKTAPIQCVVFRDSEEEIAEANAENADDLRRLRRCYETGIWPGVPAGIVELPKIWRKAA